MTELERELLAALKNVLEDVNCMLNTESFLNGFVFNKYYEAIAKAEAQETNDAGKTA